MTTPKLPPTTGPRCGEYAGYTAHRRRNETPCPPCNRARQDAENKRRRDRRKGITPPPKEAWDYAGPKPTAIEAFLTEVEFLVDARQGWHAITRALNCTPEALSRRLTKHGRYDLARTLQITNHQLEQTEAA
jgi:hypothetical protein